MRLEIGKLHQQLGATMIYVTHDQVEAMTLADKIVVLKDGLVQQIGSPMELYHNPANLFVAGFLGSPSMNFLDVDVTGVNGSKILVQNAALSPVEITAKTPGYTVGGKAKLGVRPQYLTPVEGSGMLHGRVAVTERLGAETVVELTMGDGNRLIAALARDAVFPIGAEIGLTFDPAQTHIFPA